MSGFNSDEYVKIKLTGTAENILKTISKIKNQYNITLTSPLIKHKDDPSSHVYAIIYPKEPQR